MEYLIDRKFWNKVLKKISVPDVILEIKNKLKKEQHWGTGLKVDFLLKLLNKKIILENFFKEQCVARHTHVYLSKKNQRLVEEQC